MRPPKPFTPSRFQNPQAALCRSVHHKLPQLEHSVESRIHQLLATMARERVSEQLTSDFDDIVPGAFMRGTLFDQVADFMKEDQSRATGPSDFLDDFNHDLSSAATSGFRLESGSLAELLGELTLDPQQQGGGVPSEASMDTTETMDLLSQALKSIEVHEFLQPPSVPRQPQPRPAPAARRRTAKATSSATSSAHAAAAAPVSSAQAPSEFHAGQILQPGSVGAAAATAPEMPLGTDPSDDVSFANTVVLQAPHAESDTSHAATSAGVASSGEHSLFGIADLRPASSGEGGAQAATSSGSDSDEEKEDDHGGQVGDVSADGIPLGWLPAEARRFAGQGYDHGRQEGESDLSRATPEQLAMHNDVMRKLAASVLGSEDAADKYLAAAHKLKPPLPKSAPGAAATLASELD